MRLLDLLMNSIKGFLIGVAEVIPGVSGGTIALVVGIYERVLAQAALVAKAFTDLFRSPATAVKSLRRLDLKLLLPVGIGMLTAIVVGAAVLEPLIAEQPEITLALFAGLIAASLVVPFRMVGSWRPSLFVIAAAAAALAFVLTSLPKSSISSPELWFVFLAAAVAICALVLPGVSGSFFLLAIGLYQPTIAAVNDRDFAYLGVFALGAIVGLFSFALFMQYLLINFREITLAAMTGLMLGSLRALWPWQSDTAELLAPISPGGPILAFGVGFLMVTGLIIWQGRLKAGSAQ